MRIIVAYTYENGVVILSKQMNYEQNDKLLWSNERKGEGYNLKNYHLRVVRNRLMIREAFGELLEHKNYNEIK